MTQADELRQLREHIRTDVAALHQKFDATIEKLHVKLDTFNSNNSAEHAAIVGKLAEVDKKTEVKAAVIMTKVGLIVSGISLLVSGAFAWIVNHIE
jgi:SepF-like predicted cell division protein (DUF552 family)